MDKNELIANIIRKSLIVCFLALFFVMSAFLSDYAIEEETISYDIMSKWISYGIITGDNTGDLKTFDNLKKVEALKILNKINNVQIEIKKEDDKYKDVESYRWYYDEVEKGIATGLLNGNTEGEIKPTDYLTREEAFSLIGKFFCISYKGNYDAKEYLKLYFYDGENAGKWASPYMAGLVESGYLLQDESMSLRPKEFITKIEFMEVINNIVALMINEPGEYDLSDVKGIVVINVNNVKIKNVSADAIIYLTAGSNGEVEVLENDIVIEDDIPMSLSIGNVSSIASFEKFKNVPEGIKNSKYNQYKLGFMMPTADNLVSSLSKKYYNRVKGTDTWNDLILKIANEEDIDPIFVKCIMSIESAGESGTKSKMNNNGTYDYGIMQVNTGWGNSFNYQRMLTDDEYALRCGIIVIKRKIEAAEASGKPATIHEVAWRYNGYSSKGYEYANILSTIYEDLSGNDRSTLVRMSEN